MPSSKKLRGRKKKAQRSEIGAASTSQSEAASTRNESDECEHGCPDPPPEGHVLHTFYKLIEAEVDSNEDDSWNSLPNSYGFRIIGRAAKECPEVICDADKRDIAKAVLVAICTIIILRKEDGTAEKAAARELAYAVMFLEGYERRQISGLETKPPARAIRDLDDGGDRAITCFLAKRIPCACLNAKKREVKAKQKMGLCFNCSGRFAYSSLMECTGCGVAQYCSRECQKEDWPDHKEGWPECSKKAKSKR